MKPLLYLALSLVPAVAQITQISTDATGQNLVLNTQFRLQGETDATTQQKIYRWQNGVWTRLRVYNSDNHGLVPGSIGSPFIAAGGNVYGWFVLPSHGLFPTVPITARAEVVGLTLPDGFPLENLRVSANGRYVGGWGGFTGSLVIPQIIDTQTGVIGRLPLNSQFAQAGADASFTYFVGGQVHTRRSDPSSEEVRFVVPGTILNMQMSDDARWLAVATSSDQNTTGQALRVYSFSGDFLAELAHADARGVLLWGIGNSRVVFASNDQRRVNSWDPVTRQTEIVMESAEPLTGLAVSADGSVAWTVSETNRLTRLDLIAGTRQEILPPLGFSQVAQGQAVPGSAMLLHGKFTREQQVMVNGEKWPLSDVNAQGYWFQVPWEWRGAGASTTGLLMRNAGNPFESVASITYYAETGPYFPTQIDTADPRYATTVIAAHSDFHGVVSSADPARGGENVHIYMTGLGPLQRDVPTGFPGPPEGIPIAGPMVCSGMFLDTLARTEHLPVPAVVYAAGMIGIYQLELTLPTNVPNGSWGIVCYDGVREIFGIIRTKP